MNKKMNVCKKLLILILIIFAFSSLSYAEKERKSEKKGRMPVASESSGDAKEMVKHKNSLQEAEKKQSESEEGDEEKADSKKEQNKDEDKEEKTRKDEEAILEIQGFEENAQQIQAWLEDLLERPLNLNNPKDKAIYEFWCGLLKQGYTLDQIHSLIDTVALAKKTIDFWYNGSFYQMGKVDLNDVKDHRALFNWASLILQGFSPQDVRLLIILTKTFRSEIKNNMLHRDLDVTKIKDVKIIAGWSLYRRQGYSASGVYTLFKNRLLPEIEKLIPNFNLSNPAHAGFFTYWCEKALVRLSGGLDYVRNLLNAMTQIKSEVENLIGEVDFLDNNYQDNGFITYWAEQALKKGINYIKQHLYIWKRLIPAIEQKLDRKLDLFNPEDTGIIDYWANKVEERIEEGMDLESAIQEVIDLILEPEPTIYEELIPYIEQLLGVPFDENNPQHMGFLTYWSQRAEKEGLENIENLLQAMIDIKPEVKTLIGTINFLDDDASDDGFITYWAQKALQEGTNNVKQLLQAMIAILPEVEALIGEIDFLDEDYKPEGVLSFWAQKAIREGIEETKDLLQTMNQLLPLVENLVGEIDFFDEDAHQEGFLSYWAERAQREGLENIQALLETMIAIKPEVEGLIGEINFLDDDASDDGFITNWAERALRDGLDIIKMLLSDMGSLKPLIERGIGRVLNLFDPNDSGLLSYWANEVQRLMEEEGLSHEEALARVEEIIRQTYNIEGNITFYMNDDEVVFFDEDGNVLYTYTLPEDDPDGHYTYKPEFVLISPDDSFAVVIWGLTHYPLEPHHGPSAYFGGVKITFNNTSETELEFRENAGWVNEAAMTDDGTLMIAYRPLRRLPGQIIFYDLNTNSEIANTPLQGGPETAVDMVLSPDDSRLYVLSDHAFVTIFDPQTGEVLATIETPWYYTFNWEGKLYISDDGNILTIVDKDGNEVKYDVSDLDNIHQIEEIPDEIRQALIPYVEQLLGVSFDENNPQHQGFLTYWGQRAVEEGLENIENLLQAMIDIKTEVEALIGQINFLDDNPADDGFITYWAQRALREGTDNIKALLQAMASIFPEIEALIGDVNLLDENPTDDGFLTYWAQKAIQDGIDNVKALLQAMKNILPEVEDLIGTVNLLDNNPQDDGFLTYWAQQAVGKSIEYIKQHLYIWKRLIPAIEQKLGREIDLFNSEDTGIVDFWANKVEELMAEEGLDLEEAIQKVIDMILQEEPTIYEELIPYIEQLLGEPFDENNPQYMGFLTYWSQRAEEEGLENIQNLLQAMIDIKDEVEALIGSINFLDEDASDDGFITYWAERALQEGLDTVKALLQAMKDILPEVESLIGTVNLLDANPADDGFLTYWAEQVLERDIETVQTLLDYMAQIRPHLENLVGEINLLDNSYEDNGLLTFWAEYAQQNGLQTAINIVDNMVQLKDEVEALIGPVDLYDHQYGDNGFLTYWAEYALDVEIDTVEELLNCMAEIRSEVEALIGEIDFLDNNYNDNGFITYWAEYARENGLQKTKDILSNMAAILNNDWDENGISEIEELIGEINFFDNNYDDNGFLTYWAEQALTRGVGEINMTLYIWKRLLPYVEEHEGRKLDLFNPDDSGIVSYWEGEVRRLMQEEGLELEEAIQRVIDTLSGGTSIASFLYDTSEKVLNFFKDNIGIDSETGLPYSFILLQKMA